MKKTCVILNPRAGTAAAKEALEEHLQRLAGVQVLETQEPGDAQRLAREAAAQGCELVVAAGGDGTINEVLNGLGDDFSRSRLGILPLGTANDFVRTIRVPTDIVAAIEVLLAGQEEQIDVMKFTGDETRYFLNVSAGGFSGLVNEALTDEMKQSWGPLAYLRSAVDALPNLTNYQTFVSFDDEPETEMQLYNIVIANARYVAGGIPIAPEADPTDGQADVIIVPAASMLELAVLGPQILLGAHLGDPLLIFRRAKKITVRSQPPMWFNVDGELISKGAAQFDVLPRALRIITGPVDLSL